MSLTHLGPFFRQQVLQSLDKEKAEGALWWGLPLSAEEVNPKFRLGPLHLTIII